jgi:hypothetical protein
LEHQHGSENIPHNAGFEVLTEVAMNSSLFWDIMPRFLWKSTYVSEERVTSTFMVEE